MTVGASPSCSSARSTTHCASTAKMSSAATLRSPTMIGVSSPMRRLNSRTTRSGWPIARRSAASPTTTPPSSPRYTTVGTAAFREPSSSGSYSTEPSARRRPIAAAV